MARSKYINTFNTTADYNNYIESALPEFPNVGYDKQAGEVKIMRTSPNSHVWYGEVVDSSQSLPIISINNILNTPTLDTSTNMFYLDSWSSNIARSISFTNRSNIKSIKKWKGLNTSNITSMESMFDNFQYITLLDLSNFDTSNVTVMRYMLRNCAALTSLNLSNCDTSNVTNMYNMFNGCSSLTDVYITVEATLMKLTNNLSSQGSDYIPSSATIHYNDVDYKWQNNAWTPQS